MTYDKKRASIPKLTDEERHARFLKEAKRAEASNDPEDFHRAFNSVTKAHPKKPPQAKTPDDGGSET